jgi:hypothetical protein
MSTRSRIGVVVENSVVSVYIHHDGYPSGVGAELVRDYATPEAALAVISKGDASDLGCNFYAERGEKCPPMVSKDVKSFLRACKSGEEYAYVLENGAWKCFDLHGRTPVEVEIPA